MGSQRQTLNHRGLSLVEIMISATLLLTVLALMAQTLWSGLRISGKAMNRVDLVTQASFCLSKVAADMEQTQPAGVVYEQTPSRFAMSVHRIDSLNPYGVRVWEDRVHLYLWENQSIVRSHRAGVPQGSPTRLSPNDLQNLVSEQQPRTLSSHATVFKLEDQDETTLTLELPLELTIRLEKQAQSNAPETVEMKKTIHIRNL